MRSFISDLLADHEGQDIAEYAVLLATILVLIVGTARLVGSKSNTAFSTVAHILHSAPSDGGGGGGGGDGGGGGAGGGDGATLLPGRLEWRTAFWPLFSGRVRMEMRQTDAMPDAVFVDAAPSGSTVSPGTIAVPASLLTGLGAPFNTLNMDGNVRLTWTELRMLGHNTYGQVIVTLDDMASSVSRVKPLGSYRVVFQAEGQAGTIDLTTSRGPLLLSGQGTVSPASSAFNGVATSAPEARENLAGLLNLLGRHTGPDTVALTFGR